MWIERADGANLRAVHGGASLNRRPTARRCARRNIFQTEGFHSSEPRDRGVRDPRSAPTRSHSRREDVEASCCAGIGEGDPDHG